MNSIEVSKIYKTCSSLANVQKKNGWLRFDLSVSPSSFLSRLFFSVLKICSYVTRHFECLRKWHANSLLKWYKIDHIQSKANLMILKNQVEALKDENLVSLFEKGCFSYNAIVSKKFYKNPLEVKLAKKTITVERESYKKENVIQDIFGSKEEFNRIEMHYSDSEWNEIFLAYGKTTAQEKSLIKDIREVTQLRGDAMVQILCGAHVVIEDHGKLYHKLRSKSFVVSRRSSHHNSSKENFKKRQVQYGTARNCPFLKEFLFGQALIKGKWCTWFQLENEPLCVGNVSAHMRDGVTYLATGKNIGPYGRSKHTDKNPIVVSFKN